MSGGWLCWDSIQHVLVLVSDSEYVVQFELSRLVEDCFVLFFYFHVTTSCLIAVVLGCVCKIEFTLCIYSPVVRTNPSPV